uniref:Uncharacterized protein n=1 Tax=Arundo donax TaxID=35708 RepID=A0A0A9HNY5_ARUDO
MKVNENKLFYIRKRWNK